VENWTLSFEYLKIVDVDACLEDKCNTSIRVELHVHFKYCPVRKDRLTQFLTGYRACLVILPLYYSMI
jgi:hypothetical protein